MIVPRFDAYVSTSLEVYGEYSPEERELLESLVQPGHVVVQCGANVGALTIPLARRVGATGRVIAFEPQELLYRALVANTCLTDQHHVEPVKAAVGRSAGVACLPATDYSRPGNFGGVALSAEQTETRVPLLRLDDALAQMPHCRLLHIDVEGAELDVLVGAESFIARTRPRLYIEIDRPHVREELPAWLAAHDYVGWEHHPPLFSVDNWRGVERNHFADQHGVQIVSINCLALPKGDPFLEDCQELPLDLALRPFPQPTQP